MAAFKGLVVAAFLFEAHAQFNDWNHHKNTTHCMISFTVLNSDGNVVSSGMQLCDCQQGCTNKHEHHQEVNTWNSNTGPGENDLMLTGAGMTDLPMCVIKQTSSETGNEILTAYSQDAAPFLGSCIQNFVGTDTYWWGDEDRTKCVKLDTQPSGDTFVLTSVIEDCQQGWHRTQTKNLAYELI